MFSCVACLAQLFPLREVHGHRLVQHVASQVSGKELAELRSFRNPPAVVCQVLEAVGCESFSSA